MQVSATRDAVLGEYARLAARYERRWSFYVRVTSRETLARFRINPTDSVLDVGCGTGALLSQLSASHPQARLAGIDPSPEMLALARERLPPAVELKQGWAEGIPYPDGSFDAVVSCNVFHYIREPLVALTDMLRVLRPGGTLVITDWCDDYLACRVCDWYLRLFNAAHFRTYPARRLRELLNAAGATEVRVDCYKITWLWGLMTATARKQVRNGEPTVE
jgi:ubiquinone/menaquinone biosynthesis C-methylase UbiE